MAVYERSYRRYEGPLTVTRRRPLVLTRYALKNLWGSRLFIVTLIGCMLIPLFALITIYLHHNAGALLRLQIDLSDLVAIDASFFLFVLVFQAFAAYILALFISPALISADLASNALPLYLSRPLSRLEYIAGKAMVLFVMLSLVTWVPGWILFAFQSLLEGGGWMVDNVRIAAAVFVASWTWILLLTLLSLTVSAWVRRRHLARITLLALFFVPAAMGGAINDLLNTYWGSLLDLNELVRVTWASLFLSGEAGALSQGILAGTGPRGLGGLPAWSAWLALLVLSLVCALLLTRKVKAYEVVRQ
jgi:ABC-2 type transport system permease protein